jgi:hypothetical protein
MREKQLWSTSSARARADRRTIAAETWRSATEACASARATRKVFVGHAAALFQARAEPGVSGAKDRRGDRGGQPSDPETGLVAERDRFELSVPLL